MTILRRQWYPHIFTKPFPHYSHGAHIKHIEELEKKALEEHEKLEEEEGSMNLLEQWA